MKNVFTNEKVTIEEQEILLSESLKFTGCEVLFKNCTFNAGGMTLSIFLKSCSRVLVSGCTFSNFRAPVFEERENGPMVIWDCIFRNCMSQGVMAKGLESYYQGSVVSTYFGGVINTEPIKESAMKLIMDTTFVKCGHTPFRSGIIANGYCEVYNCRYDYYGKGRKSNPSVEGAYPSKTDWWDSRFDSRKKPVPRWTLFREGTKERGNEVISEEENTKVEFCGKVGSYE